MKQKVVNLQNLVEHVLNLSHFTKQSQSLQNISALRVEVNSEAYSCSIFRIFEEFGCLTSGTMC